MSSLIRINGAFEVGVPVALADGSQLIVPASVVVDATGAPVSGGGGGGAATVADGADVTQGAKADAAWSGSGVGTVVSILKALWVALTGKLKTQPDGVDDGLTYAAWDGTAKSTAGYSTAYLEVTTYNTAMTVKSGSAAANPVDVINTSGSTSASTITATGLYLVPYAVGNLTLTGLGAGVVNLILKR